MKRKFSKAKLLTMLFIVVSSFVFCFGNCVWADVNEELSTNLQYLIEGYVTSDNSTNAYIGEHLVLNEISEEEEHGSFVVEFDGLQGFNLVSSEGSSPNGKIKLVNDDGTEIVCTLSIQMVGPDNTTITVAEGIYEYTLENGHAGGYCAYLELGGHTLNELQAANIQYVLTPEDSTIPPIIYSEKDGEKLKLSGFYVDGNGNAQIQESNKTPVERIEKAGLGGAVIGIFTGNYDETARYVIQALCNIAIPCGDSFAHMLSLAVGEVVTIDKAVFNQIHKLNINFFGSKDADPSLKNIMYDVVNTWYGIFRDIAIAVYLILLLYIGIKILLASTGSSKADYKQTFMAWIMGVAMLMFFPYVMKYTIELNNALCAWIAQEFATFQSGVSSVVTGNTRVVPAPLKDGVKMYGENSFVMMMLGRTDYNNESMVEAFKAIASSGRTNVFGSDSMMRIRYIAAARLDLPLTVIYFILIGQLLSILIIYYKRVFMLAFLITLFPLVMILYPLNKIGDVKINTFGSWFKEFFVNVFVQSFHAITYVVVVSIGINAYMQNDNWLFMIMCVTFLFEGEKIIRAIFNVKSSANTIGDMAMAGAMAMSLTKNMGRLGGKGGGGKKSSGKEDTAEEKAKKDRENAAPPKPGQTRSAQQNLEAATGGGDTTGGANAGNTSGVGGDSTEEKAAQPLSPGSQFNAIKDKVDKWKPQSTVGKVATGLGKGAGFVAGKAVQYTAQTAGAMIGFTAGMAQGKMDAAIGGAVAGLNSGKKFGQGVNNLVGGVASGVNQRIAAGIVADQYLNGDYDDELGIREADSDAEKAKNEAYRKIAAEAARRKGKRGDTSAEIKFIKDQLDRMKNE